MEHYLINVLELLVILDGNSKMIHQRNIIMRIIASGSSLVKTTKITAFTCINLQGETTAGSSRQVDKGHKNFHNSRLEILSKANSSAFPECDNLTINLMTETIRKSSAGDYQRKWKTFIDYVHSKSLNFEDIDKGIVVSFLSHLFHVKKLKPSTISHYRSALSRPLLDYFKVDLNCLSSICKDPST